MKSYLKINMPVHHSFSEDGNGRVYDPKLARFLNPDPVITNPSFTQDYNAYSYVRNNPLWYVDPSGYISQALWDRAIGILNDDNIRFGGSVSDKGVSIFKSQEDAFASASKALDQSNGWSYTEAKTKEGSEYRFNSAMGYIKRVNRKRITGININFSLGSRIHINRWSRNTKFHLDPSFSLFSYKNVGKEVCVGPVDPDPATNGGGGSADYLLAKLYWHYQFGGGRDFVLDASTLDFSGTTQRELKLAGMKTGESRGVNLFKSGLNSNALAFGKLTMTYQGGNQFSITSNLFDFDYQPNSSFSRNAGTYIGGAVFGQFYTIPITPFSIIRDVSGFGGSFDIIFNGTTTIPK